MFLHLRTSQSLFYMPGYIVNFQQKEALENVTFSSRISPRKTFLRLVLYSTQHDSILNEC